MKFPGYPEYKRTGIPWLEDVPVHWQVDRLKWSADSIVNGIWGGEPTGDEDTACIRVADFDRVALRVRLDNLTFRSVEEKDKRHRVLGQGDLLIEKSGGGEQQLVGAVVEFNHKLPAVCSNFVAKVSPAEGMHSRYWAYVHAHLYSGRVNYPSVKQTTGIQNLDSGAYFDERVIYPPYDEQKKIASFLDRETARIDALIEKKRRLLALLEEKRLAIITQAVTKGLDPDVPMKDSGIEWLGEVPAHWRLLALTRVVSRFIDYRGSTPTKIEEGIPLVTAAAIKGGKVDHSRDPVYVSEDEFQQRMTRGLPEIGDILVTTEAPLGEAARVDNPTIALGQRIILMKPEPARMTGGYLLCHFLSGFGHSELVSRASGSTASGIRADRLRGTRVLVPPLEEQSKIVAHIENATRSMAGIAATTGQQIDRLLEFRAALITNAVTGKIDVRNLVEDEAAA